MTSGTLSPLKATRDALGVRFVTELANKHVVEPHQARPLLGKMRVEKSRVWINSRSWQVDVTSAAAGSSLEFRRERSDECRCPFPCS